MNLYCVDYRGPHNKGQRVVVCADTPEKATSVAAGILEERGESWEPTGKAELIHALITPAADSILVNFKADPVTA